MKILLDIDGVLVTTAGWKIAERESDGFLKFNELARQNLKMLIEKTDATIVISSTHRISYSIDEWKKIFFKRGILVDTIEKINDVATIDQMQERFIEIREWVNRFGAMEKYVIIDDDLSINELPHEIKDNWVITKPLLGFDSESLAKALNILIAN